MRAAKLSKTTASYITSLVLDKGVISFGIFTQLSTDNEFLLIRSPFDRCVLLHKAPDNYMYHSQPPVRDERFMKMIIAILPLYVTEH